MKNPMVEITDSAQFNEQLGIPIDPGMLFSEAKMFITFGEFAECQFSFNNIMGDEVKCILRATKNPEVGEHFSGIYEKLTKVNDISYDGKNGVLKIQLESNEAGDISVYSWQADDTWYSFVIKGKPSQMEVAEVMDSVMAATYQVKEPWFELSSENRILTVRLRSNPTTGYQWSYKIGDPASVEEVTSEYIEDEHEEGMVGVGGMWVCSFRALLDDERNTDISFTYGRNWEEGNVPSKALDLKVSGKKFEITGIHEPDLSTKAASDGTYEIAMNFENMLEENELSFYAVCDIIKPVILSDAEVKALKAGQTIELAEKYPGAMDVSVEKLEKKSDDVIEVNEDERLKFDPEMGGWKIVGLDDDVTSYTVDTVLIHFTNESMIEDQMEEVLKTGNSGTIYDKMRAYKHVTAQVTVKDGTAEKITIYYHP